MKKDNNVRDNQIKKGRKHIEKQIKVNEMYNEDEIKTRKEYRCQERSFFFFQAENGIRNLIRSRGLGEVYKRQKCNKEKKKTAQNRKHSFVL